MPPGKYQMYAIFKNQHTGVPGPAISMTMEQIAELSEEQRAEWHKGVDRQLRHIERERARLDDHELWTGRVFSEKVAMEILER